MLDNRFDLICGDSCGKRPHMCPALRLGGEDLRDYDLLARDGSLKRSPLA